MSTATPTSIWTIESDNDTGSSDDSFREWWDVTDGTRSFRSTDAADAAWLRDTLEAAATAAAQTK